MGLQETGQLMQAMTASVLAQAVSAVTALGVPDLIERGGARPISELAVEAQCHERTLYRCMRYLAGHGVFEERPGRVFALTPLAEALRVDAEDSFHFGARMFGYFLPAFAELEHTLRTSEPGAQKAFGKPLFDHIAETPDFAPVFDAAMTSIHGPETPAMLAAYDFAGIGTIADVGGGNGSVLTAVLQQYPEMRGILFDLGHVSERARNNLDAAGLTDRCEVRVGSFFESFPEGADAYFMRHIIHDWTDEQCVQILRNCRSVIPSHGRLLVVEAVVPEGTDHSVAKVFDMVMMLCPGGLERTEEEYRELYAEAGFELTSITPTASPVSVVEGRPV